MVPGRTKPVMGRPLLVIGRTEGFCCGPMAPAPMAVPMRMDVPGRADVVPGRAEVPGRIPAADVLGRAEVPGLHSIQWP